MCRIEQGRENYISKQNAILGGITSVYLEIGEDFLNCRVDNFEMIVKTAECNNLNSTQAHHKQHTDCHASIMHGTKKKAFCFQLHK